MTTCIALIRGINVGRGNRVAMSDLRNLMIELGHTNVRTLLNSGNIVFQCKQPSVARIASAIEDTITANCGFSAAVTAITAQELGLIVDENPLMHVVEDHARHLVAFVTHPKHLEVLHPMLEQCWKPDALAITNRTAYLWCSTGILDSKLLKTFSRTAGATVTTRNWATVLKLQAAAKEVA